MPQNEQKNKIDFTVDRNNLYREESFTDVKVAAIRRLTPVFADGAIDKGRNSVFMGQTQIMTPTGPVVLQAILDAKTIEEAMDKFPAAMQSSMDDMIREREAKTQQ